MPCCHYYHWSFYYFHVRGITHTTRMNTEEGWIWGVFVLFFLSAAFQRKSFTYIESLFIEWKRAFFSQKDMLFMPNNEWCDEIITLSNRSCYKEREWEMLSAFLFLQRVWETLLYYHHCTDITSSSSERHHRVSSNAITAFSYIHSQRFSFETYISISKSIVYEYHHHVLFFSHCFLTRKLFVFLSRHRVHTTHNKLLSFQKVVTHHYTITHHRQLSFSKFFIEEMREHIFIKHVKQSLYTRRWVYHHFLPSHIGFLIYFHYAWVI